MPDLVLYGWPALAITIAATGFGYFWWQSRRLDRLDARDAEAARLRDDPAAHLK